MISPPNQKVLSVHCTRNFGGALVAGNSVCVEAHPWFHKFLGFFPKFARQKPPTPHALQSPCYLPVPARHPVDLCMHSRAGYWAETWPMKPPPPPPSPSPSPCQQSLCTRPFFRAFSLCSGSWAEAWVASRPSPRCYACTTGFLGGTISPPCSPRTCTKAGRSRRMGFDTTEIRGQ